MREVVNATNICLERVSDKCLTQGNGFDLAFRRALWDKLGEDTEMTDTHKALVKACADIVRDYKISISLNSIIESGVELLQQIYDAVMSGTIKERTNTDGIVVSSYNSEKEPGKIYFVPRPTIFDEIIKSKKDNGTKVVEIIKTIKNNYEYMLNDDSFNECYCNLRGLYNKKFCLELSDLKWILDKTLGIKDYTYSKKLIYAMSYKGHYEIKVKRTSKRYGKGSYISGQYIYLGSVK